MTTLSEFLERPGAATGPAVLKQLKWRYATKQFDPTRHLSHEDVATLEQAITLAPSSFGLQPWKFFFVNDPELRKKLKPAAWNQSQIVDASHLVVLAARKGLCAGDVAKYLDLIAKTRGVPHEKLADYKQMMEGFIADKPAEFLEGWAARQVYIALGVLLSSAAMLGIDTCPMEGFEPAKFNEILGLDAMGYTAVVLCALGHRSAEDKHASHAKVRHPVSEMIAHL